MTKRIQIEWAAALLTGLLIGLAQPKADWWPLAWIGWVPLILAVRGKSPKEAAKLAFAAHLVAFAVILYWIEVVVRVFGSVPFFLSWIPMALLCAYCAAWPTAAFWAARKLELRIGRVDALWMLPVFLTAAEWVRGKLFTGFPWGHPAYSQYEFTTFIQASDIVGVDGLLFVIAAANVGLAAAVLKLRGRRAPALTVVFGAVLVAATLGYGHARLAGVRAAMDESTDGLKVGLIQGNISQGLKWDAAFKQTTLEIYERLSHRAAEQGARLIIWPETAAPFYFLPDYGDRASLRVVGLARDTESYLLFGAPAFGMRDGKERSYNRAYLLNPAGEELGFYDKAHLVPFSEYVPLPYLFGFIEKMVPVVGNFAGGEARRTLAIPKAKFGTLICYESIFPSEVRDFTNDGADFLTVITNDAWFLRTSAAYQHISMAVLRAVENRRPMLQAGNTGVTAIIKADGTTQSQLPLFEEGLLVDSIAFAPIDSFYVRYGDVFAYVTLLLGALLAAWGLRTRLPGESDKRVLEKN